MGKDKTAEATAAKKKAKRNVTVGIAYIKATFNNTTVTITDTKGDTLCWASAGTSGFKGSRKSTPFAGQWPRSRPPRRPRSSASRKSKCRSRARAAAAKARSPSLEAAGLKVKSIEDVTPLPHNGCRPRKKRRV